MEKEFRCFYCGHRFKFDIPECRIKEYLRFKDSILLSIKDIDLDKSTIDVRSMTCPNCNKFGTIEAVVRNIEETVISVSNKDNFILSILYPWEFKSSSGSITKYLNGYQYYISKFIRTRDIKKLISLKSQKEIDDFYSRYPSHNRKTADKKEILKKYLNIRCKNDLEFRNKLKEISGYKIEFINPDTYLGVKKFNNNKIGKNIYGKLLMRYADKIEDEEE